MVNWEYTEIKYNIHIIYSLVAPVILVAKRSCSNAFYIPLPHPLLGWYFVYTVYTCFSFPFRMLEKGSRTSKTHCIPAHLRPLWLILTAGTTPHTPDMTGCFWQLSSPRSWQMQPTCPQQSYDHLFATGWLPVSLYLLCWFSITDHVNVLCSIKCCHLWFTNSTVLFLPFLYVLSSFPDLTEKLKEFLINSHHFLLLMAILYFF